MAQKTDLNINPYYDDFDKDKNFYKVLFKPGYPVQSRELNNIQSIFQNQIESFGNNIFKEGTMVIPGSISYDNQFNSVKLNSSNLGIDISLYINNLIGKTVTGSSTGVKASVQYVALPSDNDLVEDVTIYVKYLTSGTDSETDVFQDGETLFAEENVVYGNTTINAGTPFASLVSLNATSIGSAVSIDNGIYFVRGTFVDVSKQTIILDYYTNTPNYRVGLNIGETIVKAKDDESLYDNAKGFTNYAAPGADRFKISLTLTKKLLTDLDDTDFIEVLRVDDGKIKKIADKTVYNIIRDYIAERTYDESGHYTVDEFRINLLNSLNDRLGNDGLFLENETTDEGNIPSEDLMCVQVSPGKAYVAGYDVELNSEINIDVEKSRDTETVPSVNVPFEMGHLLRVNNVSGAPQEAVEIELKDKFKGDGPSVIGKARVYTFNLTDAAYSDAATQWDLYLYDIQTYTQLTFNRDVISDEIPLTSFIQGKSSGASGYAVAAAGGGNTLNIYQTSGTFVQNEQLTVNGVDASLSLSSFIVYGVRDIKSVSQSVSNFPSFSADSVLSRKKILGIDEVDINANTITSPGKLFTGVKVGDIIRYQDLSGDENFNEVVAVSPSLDNLTIGTLTSVPGVFDGTIGTARKYKAELGITELRNKDNAYLYANLPDVNVSSVNLSDSQLSITRQINTTEGLTVSSNTLTFNLSNIEGVNDASFESFDQEKYSVHYDDGTIATINSDAFTLSGNTVTIVGLADTTSPVVVNTTLVKNNIQSKIKNYTRSAVNIINLSTLARSGAATSDSIVDGLTYNQYYGLRVQDSEISLNVPDVSEVLAVYESTNTENPILDRIEFSSISQIDTDAIVGEDIIGTDSGAVARVVQNSSSGATPAIPTNNLGIVYLNQERFILGENVTFRESNIKSTVQSITLGKYKDITNKFTLDKGQREEYYDYSRLVRIGTQVPERRLLVVFDHYTIPSNDNGDVFTVLSYDSDRFSEDIPTIGDRNIRASDTLDFRPRVSVFDPSTATTSPFAFESRGFTANSIKFTLKPGEGSLIGYDYYLPRIDRIYLDKFANVIVRKGISSINPQPPSNEDFDLMQLGEIQLPPYLYNVDDASIQLLENRRYTMRDIGNIEDRVENLERYTSLSLLEVGTESLRIEDSNGNNRFKSGIFVDDFIDESLSDDELTTASILEGQLRPQSFSNSLQLRPIPSTEIAENELDLSENYDLLDPNVQKTGNAITLKYDSIEWINQPFATRVENVNPFHVVEYVGEIKLQPNTDNWVRTIRIPPLTIRNTVNRTNTIRVWGRTGRQIRFWQRRGSSFTISGWAFGGFLLRRPFTQRTDGRATPRARFVTRTIQIPARIRNILNLLRNPRRTVSSRTRDVLLSSGVEKYIRSRNVSFFGTGFRPLARHYQFFDSHSDVDFIPKLVEIANDTTLENYGTKSGAFQTGETVVAYNSSGNVIGRFRLAKSNHKTGKFNSPTLTYTTNPYITSENIPSSYNQSSKTLNIDLNALSAEAQGDFSGRLAKGAKLVGQTSGAIAFVKDLRLIADVNGTIFGSMFIRDPHRNPAPNPRILTGRKTYRLTSSRTNEEQLPGSTLISSGENTYTANGTFRRVQKQTTVTTTITRNRLSVRRDPLAQSFTVGRDIQAPDLNGQSDDDNGAFLTAVDLYFASKPGGNEPLTVEIRTMQLGIPTLDVIGEPKTLTPSEILTSTNGETATRVTFDYPIYLPPGDEYAVVLLAPTSDQYEVWTAKMGEKTISTANLPASESIKYSKQFASGSLFKSQNGSIWTPSQESDLKFKLYKAKFTSNTGIAHFGNPPLQESNGYVPTLEENAVTALPKTITLGITTVTDSNLIDNILTEGRRIAGVSTDADPLPSGTIVSVGSSVSGVTITDGGANYTDRNGVQTLSIFGGGTGLTLDITQSAGVINSISIANPGNGYAEGDIVSIVNGANETGRDAIVSISTITGVDTLYLTNVQGETGVGKAFDPNASQQLSYYDTDSSVVSLGSTLITSASDVGGIFSGNYLKVDHFNHGMYANNNQLILNNIKSDIAPTVLTSELTSDNTTVIEVGDSSDFETFEGYSVSNTNPGYVKIGGEVIKYESVSAGQLSGSITRGVEGVIQDHLIGSEVMKYEFSGISLRRINGVAYDISDTDIRDNSYYIEIDRGATSTIEGESIGINRLADGTYPEVSFATELIGGGNEITATENIMYNRVNPRFDILSPGNQTSISSNIRTTTSTSIDGSEISFVVPNTVESVIPNEENDLNSVRMVCSRVNELNQSVFDSVVGRRSFTSTVTLNTTDENLSPMIFVDNSTVVFSSDNINRPVTDFVNDSGANSITNDPHAAVYVSNIISLAQPASSLKVILSAYRPSPADIRVLYELVREDSAEVEQQFELFPGYNNLESTSDGVLRVVDSSLNDGRPDVRVPASERGQFLEYEFTNNDLPEFIGYRVKIVMSSTDQANYPVINDLRTIALK